MFTFIFIVHFTSRVEFGSKYSYRYFTTLKAGDETRVTLNVTSNVGKVKGLPEGDPCIVDIVEKVVVHIQWAQLCRGTTAIWLESPGGTQTTLLNTRPLDRYSGVVSTTFTSVAHLEESHLGSWSVGVSCSGHRILILFVSFKSP